MDKNKKKLHLISLGCAKNLVDSEILLGGLRNTQFDVTENLTTLAKYRGIQACCKYAEGFQIIKKVENDY